MARKSPAELIEDYKQKIQELEQKLKVGKTVKLTKESEGMEAALAAVQDAAEKNDVAPAEIIKAIARMKRTGLKFSN